VNCEDTCVHVQEGMENPFRSNMCLDCWVEHLEMCDFCQMELLFDEACVAAEWSQDK